MKRLIEFASTLAVTAVLAAGCGCGESSKNPCPDPGLECCMTDDDCASGADYMECCLVTHMCIALPDETGEEDDGCDPGYTCDNVMDIVLVQGETEEDGCMLDWSCCEAREPLSMGKIGTHSSMGVADDGTIWVSGYAAGMDESNLYGDLAAGTWDGDTGEPDWQLIDGVPWDETPYAPPDGWRGGINVPGDDVGLYTSLALDASMVPRIAYHDATNGALKYITRDGGDWNDPLVVDDDGFAGRYASMLLLSGDVPAVAYRAHDVEMADYTGATSQVGTVVTSLRYAVATDATAATWTIEDAVTGQAPCWPGACPDDLACRVDDGLCWTVDETQCTEECAAGTACLQDTDGAGSALATWSCNDVVAADAIYDLPEGIALWNSLALSPIADPEVVYYDRTRGELAWTTRAGGAWATPVILDGDDLSADPTIPGDKGWHPSLAIAADGTRHVCYVDGLAETLMYMQVDPAGTVVVRETVDDGTWGGTTGKELVGDYGNIAIDADGRVRIVYQNTSQGLVMMAVRDPSSFSWTVSIASDPGAGFMGYYIDQVIVDGTSWISQFTFNYEAEPNYRGLRVFSCTLDSTNNAICG